MLTYAREPDCFNLYRAHEDDAGFDIGIPEGLFLKSYENRCIKTGIHILLHENEIGMIFPRSSTSRAGIMVFPGVIDCGYRGELGIQVMNMTYDDINLARGHRIAQLVVMYRSIRMDTVKEIPLDKYMSIPGSRGINGFGSSGSVMPSSSEHTSTVQTK